MRQCWYGSPLVLSGDMVVVTGAPLFATKAALLPDSSFVVGYDTAIRLINVSGVKAIAQGLTRESTLVLHTGSGSPAPARDQLCVWFLADRAWCAAQVLRGLSKEDGRGAPGDGRAGLQFHCGPSPCSV